MAAGRGAAAVQGTPALAAARLRRLPRCGPRCADPLRAGDRPRRDRLRDGPDVCDALLPEGLLHRLGHRRQPRCEPPSPRWRRAVRHPGARTPGLRPGVRGIRPQAHGNAASEVYEPQPLPDDTGQYGIYTDTAHSARGGEDRQQDEQQPQYTAYDPYTGYAQPSQDTYSGQGAYQAAQDAYPGQESYQGQDGYATGQYDYGTGQAGYAAYSDPYIGTGTTAGTGQHATYDSYGNAYDNGYGGQQPTDAYAGQYASDTPPGGVWVPQQRESEQYPPMPPEAPTGPAPYGNGYDTGQNEQYRY